MRTCKKLAGAAAMAVVLLVTGGTPAGAGGPYPLDLTGGSVLTALGSWFDFDLTPTQGVPPCPTDPTKPEDLRLYTDADAYPTAGPGRWTIGGAPGGFGTATSFMRLGTPPTGPWYQVDHTFIGFGTYAANATPPPDFILSGSMTIQMRIYELDLSTCAKTNLKCVLAGRFGITSGSYTGTLPVAGAGDAISIAGSTSAPGGLNLYATSCSAPWVALSGSAATLSGMTLTA